MARKELLHSGNSLSFSCISNFLEIFFADKHFSPGWIATTSSTRPLLSVDSSNPDRAANGASTDSKPARKSRLSHHACPKKTQLNGHYKSHKYFCKIKSDDFFLSICLLADTKKSLPNTLTDLLLLWLYITSNTSAAEHVAWSNSTKKTSRLKKCVYVFKNIYRCWIGIKRYCHQSIHTKDTHRKIHLS